MQCLSGQKLLVLKDRRCSHPESCQGQDVLVRAQGPLADLVLRGTEYGLDVLHLIGEKRHHHHLSFPEVHGLLSSEFGVTISERHVPNLFRLYLALLECRSVREEAVRARLRQQGRLVISGDAVRFDDHSPRLYVFREVISGEILVAARVEVASRVALSQLLAPIREIGVPVVGTICDKEESLLGAFQDVFPEAKHQICQAHYVMNLVKPMSSELTSMNEGVREVVRRVRDIETTLDRARVASPAELNLARDLCRAVGALGKSQAGDKLKDPPALKRFRRLNDLADRTQQVLEMKGGTWPLLTRILAALTALGALAELGRRLDRQFDMVRQILRLLDSDGPAEAVAGRLRTFLDGLIKEAPRRGRGAPRGRFIDHVVKVSERFWVGLFECYNHPDIPRTNNALEQFFNSLKRDARRLHGGKSTSGGPLDSLAPILVELWNRLEEKPSLAEVREGLSPEKLREARQRLEEISEPARRRRSFLRDPDSHLGRSLTNFLTD